MIPENVLSSSHTVTLLSGTVLPLMTGLDVSTKAPGAVTSGAGGGVVSTSKT